MVFCNRKNKSDSIAVYDVTILILIDGFLQCYYEPINTIDYYGHNPYFNRWFSAIKSKFIKFLKAYNVTILILIDGFLQLDEVFNCPLSSKKVTILILIDGFLQCM